MLKQRVLTAILLAIVFLTGLFLLPWSGFVIAIGIVIGFAAWEWSDLSGLTSWWGRVLYVAVLANIAVIAGFWTQWASNLGNVRQLLIAACVWWGLGLLWIQSYPASAVLWGSKAARMVIGAMVLVPAWLACVYLRVQSVGAWLIFLLVLLVAAADIGAYFTGKAIGKRKLAPSVSPGKSWEGVFGGAVWAFIVAFFFSLVLGGAGLLSLLIMTVATAFVSVVGDLLESMVKRHRGVKDSGQLLPGHGGVLDRIDGLVAAAPVFALAYMLGDWQL